MSPAQLAALRRVTDRAEVLASYYREPAMTWRIEPLAGGRVLLVGSSIDHSARKWHDPARMLFATIGPRGAVSVSSETSKLYR